MTKMKIENKDEIIIYKTKKRPKLEVQLKGETVRVGRSWNLFDYCLYWHKFRKVLIFY